MESVVLVIHLILALLIIGLVLLQRSEGGGLGIGGGSGGGLGNLASARGTANALTKMTALCALGFFVTSLTLGVLAGQHSRVNQGILENISESEIQAPVIDDDISAPAGVTYIPPEEMPSVEPERETETVPEPSVPTE